MLSLEEGWLMFVSGEWRRRRDTDFRALMSPSHSSDLPILYDAVHCTEQDTQTTKNIFDCATTTSAASSSNGLSSSGQCDARNEAAAVLCGRLPSVVALCTYVQQQLQQQLQQILLLLLLLLLLLRPLLPY